MINVGEDVEKWEPSHTVGGHVNGSHSGKQLHMGIPYEPAIPLLVIYSTKWNTRLSLRAWWAIVSLLCCRWRISFLVGYGSGVGQVPHDARALSRTKKYVLSLTQEIYPTQTCWPVPMIEAHLALSLLCVGDALFQPGPPASCVSWWLLVTPTPTNYRVGLHPETAAPGDGRCHAICYPPCGGIAALEVETDAISSTSANYRIQCDIYRPALWGMETNQLRGWTRGWSRNQRLVSRDCVALSSKRSLPQNQRSRPLCS